MQRKLSEISYEILHAERFVQNCLTKHGFHENNKNYLPTSSEGWAILNSSFFVIVGSGGISSTTSSHWNKSETSCSLSSSFTKLVGCISGNGNGDNLHSTWVDINILKIRLQMLNFSLHTVLTPRRCFLCLFRRFGVGFWSSCVTGTIGSRVPGGAMLWFPGRVNNLSKCVLVVGTCD